MKLAESRTGRRARIHGAERRAGKSSRACSCTPPEGLELPPLAKLLEPDFSWPDLAFPILGYSLFRAGAGELEYLNHAIAQVEGRANFASGALDISTFLLEN